MYNSELWTITKKLENSIDTFHRNLLRKTQNIKWPHVITNDQLYERTREVKWSKRIEARRLRWLGHLMRLPEDSPARLALIEALKPSRRPQGRPKTTWISNMNKELQSIDPTLKLGTPQLEELCKNRAKWNSMIRERQADQRRIA